MAHFRGLVHGSRKEVTRLGTKKSGLMVEAQSWEGKVSVILYHNVDKGKDYCKVSLVVHHGHGTQRVLYHGPVNGSEPG